MTSSSSSHDESAPEEAGRTPTPPAPLVGGDQIIVGDISHSVVAAGEGAQALVNNIDTYVEKYIERALTGAEEAEKARALERERLAGAVKAYLQRLQQLAGQGREASPRSNPYTYVRAYELPDADRFAGRDALAQQLLDKIVCSTSLCRLAVLDGRARVGKTSLLRAGIVPWLVGAEHLPLYVRLTPGGKGSLARRVKEALLPDLSATPLLAEVPLREFVRQVADLLPEGKRVFVLLDQFEAVLDGNGEDHAAFGEELATSLYDDDPRDHWLICIDASRTSDLNALFQPAISYPLANTLKVPFLSRKEARAAIVVPAERYGLAYEDGLVDALLDALGGDVVDPSYLQVVCYALVEALPPGLKRLTRAAYEELGEVAGVLGAHLDRAMSGLPAASREAGWQALVALSETGDHELEARLRVVGLRPTETREALAQLQTNGLVRDEGGQVSLATDHFLPRIREWAKAWAAQQAVSEHVRTEFRRQAQYILGSALRGMVGGALGFALAYWLAFAGQYENFLGQQVLFRVFPGALAGVITVLAADVGLASASGGRGRWLPWLWAGGGGALGVGLALAYNHIFFLASTGLFFRPQLLLTLLPAAVEGGLWGLITGLGVVWVLRRAGSWQFTLLKMVGAAAFASVVLWLADADLGMALAGSNLPGWLSGGGHIGDAFLYPEPPGLLFATGAVMPLCVMGAALLPRLRLGRKDGQVEGSHEAERQA